MSEDLAPPVFDQTHPKTLRQRSSGFKVNLLNKMSSPKKIHDIKDSFWRHASQDVSNKREKTTGQQKKILSMHSSMNGSTKDE